MGANYSNGFLLVRPRAAGGLRALWAVVRREWLIFIRYPSWVLALIVWPVLFPALYILTARALAGPDGVGLAQFKQLTGSEDYLGYIVVGTTVWMIQNMVLWTVGFTLRDEQLRGTLESNWLSPTWRFSFLLGAGITNLVSISLFLAAAVVEFRLLFGIRLVGSPLLLLLVLLLSIPAVYGLGFTFASLVITVKEANAFVFLVRGLVMIFCGITFPIALLPGWMQTAALWMPQTYVISASRKVLLSAASLGEIMPDLIPLTLFGVLWLATGYSLFVWMERQARRKGTIGHY
jgi:ABC-2 type transport system permease protein